MPQRRLALPDDNDGKSLLCLVLLNYYVCGGERARGVFLCTHLYTIYTEKGNKEALEQLWISISLRNCNCFQISYVFLQAGVRLSSFV